MTSAPAAGLVRAGLRRTEVPVSLVPGCPHGLRDAVSEVPALPHGDLLAVSDTPALGARTAGRDVGPGRAITPGRCGVGDGGVDVDPGVGVDGEVGRAGSGTMTTGGSGCGCVGDAGALAGGAIATSALGVDGCTGCAVGSFTTPPDGRRASVVDATASEPPNTTGTSDAIVASDPDDLPCSAVSPRATTARDPDCGRATKESGCRPPALSDDRRSVPVQPAIIAVATTSDATWCRERCERIGPPPPNQVWWQAQARRRAATDTRCRRSRRWAGSRTAWRS